MQICNEFDVNCDRTEAISMSALRSSTTCQALHHIICVDKSINQVVNEIKSPQSRKLQLHDIILRQCGDKFGGDTHYKSLSDCSIALIIPLQENQSSTSGQFQSSFVNINTCNHGCIEQVFNLTKGQIAVIGHEIKYKQNKCTIGYSQWLFVKYKWTHIKDQHKFQWNDNISHELQTYGGKWNIFPIIRGGKNHKISKNSNRYLIRCLSFDYTHHLSDCILNDKTFDCTQSELNSVFGAMIVGYYSINYFFIDV